MNRRQFLRRSALAALMATPAMRVAALVGEFGLPANLVAVGEGLMLPNGRTIERVGFLAAEFGLDRFSRCVNLDQPGELLPMDELSTLDSLTVNRGPFCFPAKTWVGSCTTYTRTVKFQE